MQSWSDIIPRRTVYDTIKEGQWRFVYVFSSQKRKRGYDVRFQFHSASR